MLFKTASINIKFNVSSSIRFHKTLTPSIRRAKC